MGKVLQEFCRWAELLFLKNKRTDIQMMKNKWKITAAAILGTAGILTARIFILVYHAG